MRPDRPPLSNLARFTSVLSGFDGINTPRRSNEIIAGLRLSRTTGFALLRRMVQDGFLERVDHGWVRLGPAARGLIFAPLDSHHTQITASRIRATSASLLPVSPAAVDRGRWNPAVVELVETERFRAVPPFRIGFANASSSNPWRRALLSSMHYAVRLHRNNIADFVYRDAGDDPERQCAQIDALVETGIDLLIVSAARDPDGCLSRHLGVCGRSGMPIIAVDRRPDDVSALVSFVTSSDRMIGRDSAVWLAEKLQGRGHIWLLSGLEGASPSIRRRAAAQEAFAAYPEIKVDAAISTGWTEEGGYQAVENLLEKFGACPDGVWSDSGLQGVGSIRAFLDHGLAVPPHTGGDLNKMYKLAIRSAVPFVAVDYPAAMGARSIDTALAVLSGEPVPRRVETQLVTVMPRGCETLSIKADEWAELHVRWDLPDDAVLSQGPSLRLDPDDFSKGGRDGAET
jgi:ABC-type sugar transport system substrate-binding protein